jgi:hypothetical protein
MQIQKRIIVVLFIVFSFGVKGQEHYFTAVGGLNVAHMMVDFDGASIEDSYKLTLGFHAGGYFNYVLSKDRKKELSIEPGLLFDTKGYKQEFDNGMNQKNTLTAYYADVPVYFKYTKKLRSRDKAYIGIGPYVGMGIFGTIKYSMDGGEDNSENISWGNDPTENDLKRLDYGASAKAGYVTYGGLNVSATYDYGIANVSAAENPAYKNGVFRFSIGYSFNLDN